jgi:hypothetical protein
MVSLEDFTCAVKPVIGYFSWFTWIRAQESWLVQVLFLPYSLDKRQLQRLKMLWGVFPTYALNFAYES